MQADKIARLRHAVLGRLESLQQAGVLQLPKGRVEVAQSREATTCGVGRCHRSLKRPRRREM